MISEYERRRLTQVARNKIIEAMELLREAAKDTRIEGELKERVEPDMLAAALFLHQIQDSKTCFELRPWKLTVPTGLYASKYDHNEAVYDYLCAVRQGFKYNGDESKVEYVIR